MSIIGLIGPHFILSKIGSLIVNLFDFSEKRDRRRLLQARQRPDQGERPPPGHGGAQGAAVQAAGAHPALGQGQVRRGEHQDQGKGRRTHLAGLRHQAGALKVTRRILPEV